MAQGKAYERRLGRHLKRLTETKSSVLSGGTILDGPWIKFTDENGFGWAQPDFIIDCAPLLWIIEAKLSHTPDAEEQLTKLYSPLCHEIWPDHGQILVEACHNLGIGRDGRLPPKVKTLTNILETAPRTVYLWHYL